MPTYGNAKKGKKGGGGNKGLSATGGLNRSTRQAADTSVGD